MTRETNFGRIQNEFWESEKRIPKRILEVEKMNSKTNFGTHRNEFENEFLWLRKRIRCTTVAPFRRTNFLCAMQTLHEIRHMSTKIGFRQIRLTHSCHDFSHRWPQVATEVGTPVRETAISLLMESISLLQDSISLLKDSMSLLQKSTSLLKELISLLQKWIPVLKASISLLRNRFSLLGLDFFTAGVDSCTGRVVCFTKGVDFFHQFPCYRSRLFDRSIRLLHPTHRLLYRMSWYLYYRSPSWLQHSKEPASTTHTANFLSPNSAAKVLL